MLNNRPMLIYNRPHHWLWMVRRIPRFTGFLKVWFVLFIFAVLFMAGSEDLVLEIVMGSLGALVVMSFVFCSYLYLDWRTRIIHLYSDGRLDYEYGITHREGKSVSMRLGAVKYVYHNRIAVWLDCADLVLPFESGTIDAIAEFRYFWDIAQGRR